MVEEKIEDAKPKEEKPLSEEQKKALEDKQAAAKLETEKSNKETNAAAARLEKANAESKDILAKKEAADNEAALGGTTNAGQEEPEETPEDYKNRVMAGEVGDDVKEA